MVLASDQRNVTRSEWNRVELLRNWTILGLVVALGLLSGCPIPRPPAQCSSDADCDNGVFCDGAESCVDNVCRAGTSPCEPGSCDEQVGVCISLCSTDDDCDDGLFCNGAEICDVEGRCQDGVAPCSDGKTCFEGTGCVECITSLDCADGEECIDFACEPVLSALTVTLDGCPEDLAIEREFTLTAIVTGASDSVTFAWTGTTNVAITGDADADPDVVNVEAIGSPLGAEITVRVQRIRDTTPIGDPVTATCGPFDTIFEHGPVVSAGEDTSTVVVFTEGAPIVFSTAGVAFLEAVAFDNDAEPGDTLQYAWSPVSTPDSTSQPLETVAVLQPLAAGDGVASVDVQIDPPGVATVLNLLKWDGSVTTRSDGVVPGPYIFGVSVTTVRGLTDYDTVVRTIVPRWLPQVSEEGDLAGLSAAGGIYNTVVPPNTTTNLAFSSLSRIDSTIDFTSVDDDVASLTAELASVDVAAGDAIVSIMPQFPGSPVGTYSINAALDAGDVSVDSASTGVKVLVGADLASATANTTLNVAALSEVGRPRSNGTIRYVGVTHDAVGTVGDTAEVLRGQNILFAEIKNDGQEYVIVWGADDAGGAYDANDVRIYKPLTNQAGNANTFGFDVANFTLLEILDTGAPVTGCAVGALRGNVTTPELVICQAGATGPVVKVYQNNGATDADDKVYSVRADQSTMPLISTITLDYTNAGTGPPTIALARFSEATHDDLIVGDPFFDNGADGFIEGRVVILQGGTANAIPQAGFSASSGASFENLPANTWDSYTGIAADGDDEPFFGFALATASFTVASLDDIYVGAPGNDAATANGVSIPGSVFRIPGGTVLDSTDATTNGLAVSWSGEANGDQFGFRAATARNDSVVIAAIQNGHTPNSADGQGKVYVYSPSNANNTIASTVPGVQGEQSGDIFGARLATGTFETAEMLVAASPAGNYFKLIPTSGTLTNPIIPMTRMQLSAIDTVSAIVIGDCNGDGQNDIVISQSDSDDVTALWGRQ